MKFTKLRLRWGTGSGDVLTLYLNQMNSISTYFVKGITGLEPADLNLAIAVKAEEGGIRQGDNAINRELVILLGFQPEYGSGQTVSDLRQALYGMLRPKLGGSITIQLMNEEETDIWSTSGYVKTMTPNIFTKDPELQIAISCLSPYFDGANWTHPNPASLSGKSSFQITNAGNARSGFIMDVGITVADREFLFWNEIKSKWFQVTFQLAIDDRLIINTIVGQRSVTLIRNGTPMNMLQYVSPNSVWLQMDGGVNTYQPNTTGYKINSWVHQTRYWGI